MRAHNDLQSSSNERKRDAHAYTAGMSLRLDVKVPKARPTIIIGPPDLARRAQTYLPKRVKLGDARITASDGHPGRRTKDVTAVSLIPREIEKRASPPFLSQLGAGAAEWGINRSTVSSCFCEN